MISARIWISFLLFCWQTLHYRFSNANKKKKKMSKSQHLCCAQFWTKTDDSFLKKWNSANILQKKIFFQVQNVKKWPLLTKQNWKGWSHNLETFHEENPGVLQKRKPKKTEILWWQPFRLFFKHRSQIFLIWNNSRPRKWEQRSSFCQILKFQFP